MSLSFSQRAIDIPPSPIRKLLPLELEAKKRGTHIYKLNIGQPDIPTPEVFFRSLNSDLPQVLGYGPSQGLPEFQKAVADYYKRIGLPVEPHEVMATIGGSEALFFAFLAVANPGDEIIVFEPFYTNYIGFAIYAGVTLVPYTTRAENGFHLPAREEIERLVTPRTRAILVCSPNNPTGTVLTRAEMEMVLDIAQQRDLFVISDEVYEHIVFDGEPHRSVATSPLLAERSVVISSFGKTFHTTGWKIGYACAPRAISAELRKVHQFMVFAVNTPGQHAVARYLEDAAPYETLAAFYQAKRDRFAAGLAHTRFRLLPCEGTYFLLADYSAISDLPDAEFAQKMIVDYGVAVIPVSGFYERPFDARVVRFCFAKKDETLSAALERLHAV